MKKTITLGALAAFSASALLPFAAFAQVASGTVGTTVYSDTEIQAVVPGEAPTKRGAANANANLNASGTMIGTQLHVDYKDKHGADMEKHNEKRVHSADAMITGRIAALNKLSSRLNSEKRLTAEQKATLSASLSATISDLTALEAKINAGTSSTTAADKASITKDYRVYELVLPQASIEASADRELEVVAEMQTLGTKLESRIAELKAKGMSTTVQDAAYADFTAKLSAAQVSAKAAVSVVAGLKADNGDKTIEAANKAALKTGRDDVKSAEASLKAARADVRVIVKANGKSKGHGKKDGMVNATTSTTTTVR